MTVTLAAVLFYGFPLLETHPEHEDFDHDLAYKIDETLYNWDTQLAQQGLGERPVGDREASMKWADLYRANLALVPCVIKYVGWSDRLHSVLAIRSACFVKKGGDSEAIQLPPANAAEWDLHLEAWCAQYGFKFRTPSWQLGALYF